MNFSLKNGYLKGKIIKIGMHRQFSLLMLSININSFTILL